MKLALDAKRYTDLCWGEARAVQVLRAAEEIWVPLNVLAELRAALAAGTGRDGNERTLTRFLATPRVKVLAPDEQTTKIYAELHLDLKRRGRPISTNALWTAALVVQHDLVLFDRDSDFDALPRLARL